jgi:DNA repair ATPase RecN
VTTNPTITLPRLDREHPARYEARTLYVTMGPDRSLEAVRQKLGKSKALMERWSTQDNWVEHAKKYDDQINFLTVHEAETKYRADLEAHRKRAGEASQALYAVAGQLIKAVNQALANPKKIEGKDGRVYTLHGVELNAGAFSTAAKAMQIALDIEAHGLGVDQLLPSLTNDSE